MDRLTAMKVFSAVARLGSFSAAAASGVSSGTSREQNHLGGFRTVHAEAFLGERRDPGSAIQALNPSKQVRPFRFGERKRPFDSVEVRQRLESAALTPGHETQGREETGKSQNQQARCGPGAAWTRPAWTRLA